MSKHPESDLDSRLMKNQYLRVKLVKLTKNMYAFFKKEVKQLHQYLFFLSGKTLW